MKEEILSITSDLREGSMTTNEAKEHLLRLFGVSGSLSEFDLLDEEEGSGNYCCGKRMVGKGIMYVCLNCGAEENSSS